MKQLFANNAKTTLAAPITVGSTGLVVADGSRFPNPGANEYFLATIELGGQIEIVMITGRTGNSLVIGGFVESGQTVAGRGQELSIPKAFSIGAKVECRVTKGTLDRAYKGLTQIANVTSIVAPSASYQEGYVANSPTDPAGNPVVIVTKDTLTWRFLNYTIQHSGVVSTSNTVSLVATAGIPITDSGSNKFLIQFTSGTLAGQIRSVASISGTNLSWTGVTGSAPAAGVTFEVYKSNSAILSDLNVSFPIANNTGTANAIVATYGSSVSLTDNVVVMVVLTTPTTVSNPTFAPNGLAAKTIVTNVGGPLQAGLDGTLLLRYENTTDDWRLVGIQSPNVVTPLTFFVGNF